MHHCLLGDIATNAQKGLKYVTWNNLTEFKLSDFSYYTKTDYFQLCNHQIFNSLQKAK